MKFSLFYLSIVFSACATQKIIEEWLPITRHVEKTKNNTTADKISFEWNRSRQYIDDFCAVSSNVQGRLVQELFDQLKPSDNTAISFVFTYYDVDTDINYQMLPTNHNTTLMALQYLCHIYHDVWNNIPLKALFLDFNILNTYLPIYTPTLPIQTIKDITFQRYDVLEYIKFFYNTSYSKYLEIGTDKNTLFIPASTHLFSYSIGVDPIAGGTHRMTSDTYFHSLQSSHSSTMNNMNIMNNVNMNFTSNMNNISKELFDVIFIDGLHEANQVFRDVIHSLNYSHENSIILLHDCNPMEELRAIYPYPKEKIDICWNGDTWKAIVTLRMRSDLDIAVIDADHGIGVILRRLNSKPLSNYWQQYLSVNPISMLTYQHLESHRIELLNLISISDFKKWLIAPI